MTAVIGTWNLENLYRYRPDGDFGPSSRAAYDATLAALAATITEIAPDVLAVQEVGEPEALEDLIALLGGGWHRALSRFPTAAASVSGSSAGTG